MKFITFLIITVLVIWVSPALLELFFYLFRKKIPDIPPPPIPEKETEQPPSVEPTRVFDGIEWDIVQPKKREIPATSKFPNIKLEINED